MVRMQQADEEAEDDEEGEEEDDDSVEGTMEVRFVPREDITIDRIFKAFSDCALLNPDTDEGVYQRFF